MYSSGRFRSTQAQVKVNLHVLQKLSRIDYMLINKLFVCLRDKRGREAQKAKSKLKSALRSNVTMVTALDDKEKSMGSPSEEVRCAER